MSKKTTVKMTQHVAGAGRDDELVPGKTYDLEPAYAERLIEREFAEPVTADKKAKKRKPETATHEERETADLPAAERR